MLSGQMCEVFALDLQDSRKKPFLPKTFREELELDSSSEQDRRKVEMERKEVWTSGIDGV